jgi:DNA-binding transcriptional ArsR family regulator
VLSIEKPEQLKALGHPLRLRVLQVLGDEEAALTNRELAERLGVDPGHLHFHVRMLMRAGLIELTDDGRGREKPYRLVAQSMRISPELRAAGAANEIQAALLETVQRGWEVYAPKGKFRSAQITIRVSEERLRELVRGYIDQASEAEDMDEEAHVITLLVHPALEHDD